MKHDKTKDVRQQSQNFSEVNMVRRSYRYVYNRARSRSTCLSKVQHIKRGPCFDCVCVVDCITRDSIYREGFQLPSWLIMQEFAQSIMCSVAAACSASAFDTTFLFIPIALMSMQPLMIKLPVSPMQTILQSAQGI